MHRRDRGAARARRTNGNDTGFETLRKTVTLPLLLLAAVTLSACSGLNSREQKMLSGGAIGAGVGAVGTAITGGCVACGAAIGGAVGVGAGYVLDKTQRK
jgi:hypothetical protein